MDVTEGMETEEREVHPRNAYWWTEYESNTTPHKLTCSGNTRSEPLESTAANVS